MDILSNFAENLADILFENNLSVDEFAKSVDINLSEVYLYRKKKYLPSTVNILKIADTYHCSIDGLLGFAPFSTNTHSRASQPFEIGFKLALAQKGITRYQLSKTTRLAASSIDDWYHGKRLPSVDNLLFLKNYFNCTVDYLFGRE